LLFPAWILAMSLDILAAGPEPHQLSASRDFRIRAAYGQNTARRTTLSVSSIKSAPRSTLTRFACPFTGFRELVI
jgi:hypothetical protein